MRYFKSLLFASTLLSASALSAQADVNVVASVKPIHSLVSAVMEGVGAPQLIIEGAGSPHTYALKPSQAKDLQNACQQFCLEISVLGRKKVKLYFISKYRILSNLTAKMKWKFTNQSLRFYRP